MRSEEDDPQRLSVPLSAIYAPAMGGTFVWVVGGDNRVERRRVVLGDIFGRDMVVVISGLREGEKVVTAGVYKLQEGVEVKVIND
jgi:multidrug efflux pump subunit AcrA (membrane-fusion protein)